VLPARAQVQVLALVWALVLALVLALAWARAAGPPVWAAARAARRGAA